MDAVILKEITKEYKLSRKQRKELQSDERSKTAVKDLSFNVKQGEIFGLLGPNGAGKTTTLRILATLIKPNSGEAFINGYSVTEEPEKVRSSVGFLTSELKMEEVFTPDYLFNFFSELHNVDQEICRVRKNQLFEKFEIDKYAQTKIADLSTGMKQKVSLVVALAHNPQTIIFDEPTNGLDLVAAKMVTEYLLELKAQGKTILLSTHLFDLVERVCDRVGMIINGKMMACDYVNNFRTSDSLESLFFDIYDKSNLG